MLATVYAIRVGDKYVPRSSAALTSDMPKLWVMRKDAKRAAKRATKRYGQDVKIVVFSLQEVGELELEKSDV